MSSIDCASWWLLPDAKMKKVRFSEWLASARCGKHVPASARYLEPSHVSGRNSQLRNNRTELEAKSSYFESSVATVPQICPRIFREVYPTQHTDGSTVRFLCHHRCHTAVG